MRRKIAAGIVTTTLVITGVGCAQQNASAQETSQTQSIQSEEIGFENISTKTEVEKLMVQGNEIEMEISYPELMGLDNTLLQDRVNKTIHQAFRSEHALLAGESNVVAHSFDVTYLSSDYISIRFDFEVDPTNEGKDIYELFTSFTVDMTTGEPVLFHNMWKGLDDEKKSEFKALVDMNLEENVQNPVASKDAFVEAYLNESSLMLYYFDEEMKTIALPIQEALSLLNS